MIGTVPPPNSSSPTRCPMNALTCVLLACTPAGPVQDDPARDPAPPAEAPAADETRAALIAGFRDTMRNATLTGRFTVDGKPGDREERYEIGQVTHHGGDTWTIAARIRYGDNDVTVPVAVEVKWAGDTPVITLDRLAIPGLGTFDARVLVHATGTAQTRYAGTWQHDKVGGCLFGTVEPGGTE